MKILIVDDMRSNRMLLRSSLAEEKFTDICEASSGEAALEFLGITGSGQPQEEVDLILMDVVMTGISGVETNKRIKAAPRYADLPIIMVTGIRELDTLKEAFDAGAHDYLTKPWKKIELGVRVRAALNLRREMKIRKEREQELIKLQESLVEKNEKLLQLVQRNEQELQLAALSQKKLLPPANLDIPGLGVSWHFEPCSGVGGDLLNVIPISKRHTAFFLFDVAGHGVHAALLSFTLSHVLSNRSRQEGLLETSEGQPRHPAEVVRMLNERFQSNDDSNQYFTIIYGILDHEQKTLSFCQAGHPSMIKAGKDGSTEDLGDGGFPVGLVQGAEFEENQVQLTSGDRLLLYSDGLTESRHDGTMEHFGEARVHEILRSSRSIPFTHCLPILAQAARNWRGESPPNDDISILLMELK